MRRIISFLPTLLLAACASTSANGGTGDDARASLQLDGTDWRIVSVDGIQAGGARAPTMAFADGRVSGSSGCNRYSGRYSRNDDAISIGAIISTKMACVGNGMDGERRLFAALQGMLTVASPAPDRLTLSGNEHVVTLERAD